MKLEELKKAQVMLWFAHGWKVETYYRMHGGWSSDENPSWAFDVDQYRIEPTQLNIPDGWEIVPLGEKVVGQRKLKDVSGGGWLYYDSTFVPSNVNIYKIYIKPKPRQTVTVDVEKLTKEITRYSGCGAMIKDTVASIIKDCEVCGE